MKNLLHHPSRIRLIGGAIAVIAPVITAVESISAQTPLPIPYPPNAIARADVKAPAALPAAKPTAKKKGRAAEVERIHSAINLYYANRNARAEPRPPSWSGACGFLTVDSLVMLSLTDNEAKVSVRVTDQSYSLLGDSRTRVGESWGFRYKKLGDPIYRNVVLKMEKKDGQWILASQNETSNSWAGNLR